MESPTTYIVNTTKDGAQAALRATLALAHDHHARVIIVVAHGGSVGEPMPLLMSLLRKLPVPSFTLSGPVLGTY